MGDQERILWGTLERVVMGDVRVTFEGPKFNLANGGLITT